MFCQLTKGRLDGSTLLVCMSAPYRRIEGQQQDTEATRYSHCGPPILVGSGVTKAVSNVRFTMFKLPDHLLSRQVYDFGSRLGNEPWLPVSCGLAMRAA